MVKGFIPWLYDVEMKPRDLYSAYFATYIERDVRRLVNVKGLEKFEVFLRLLAGRVGQLVNLSALSGDVGVSSTTLAGWLSVFEPSLRIWSLWRCTSSGSINGGLMGSRLKLERPMSPICYDP